MKDGFHLTFIGAPAGVRNCTLVADDPDETEMPPLCTKSNNSPSGASNSVQEGAVSVQEKAIHWRRSVKWS